MKRLTLPIGIFLAVWISTACCAQVLRIGSWNVSNGPNAGDTLSFSIVVEALGRDVRPAILAIQESDSSSSTDLRDIFNDVFSVDSYRVIVTTPDGGNDRTGFVYDTSLVTLVSQSELTDGLIHNTMRATFQPLDPTFVDPVTVYSIHLKSGVSNSDVNIRMNEAAVLNSDAVALNVENVIFAGDFNAQGSYQLANFDALDVADAPGDWRDNPDFIDLHTQNPNGNVDDRFDLQLASAGLFDGTGLNYLEGSYNVLGNNGTHVLGSWIDTGTGDTPEVLAALISASDHLPVYSDFVFIASEPEIILGDVNQNGFVNFLDVTPFIGFLTSGEYRAEADCNQDGVVNFLDIASFVSILEST